jgi:hypothetical protein
MNGVGYVWMIGNIIVDLQEVTTNAIVSNPKN